MIAKIAYIDSQKEKEKEKEGEKEKGRGLEISEKFEFNVPETDAKLVLEKTFRY